MKKIILFLGLVAFGLNSQAQIQNYNLGDVVDDFTVTDTEGNQHNLYSLTSQGKYVFVDFFFVDCPPCQQTTPIFNELHDKYGCNEGDVFCISVNTGQDNDAQVIQFEDTYGGDFNHAPAVSGDGGSAAVDSNFNPVAYPTYCLINPNNEIINLDIWPLTGVETFEATFPSGFEPPAMECSVLGLEEAILEDAFRMYPNPSNTGSVNLTIGIQFDSAEVTIYNVLGAAVFTTQLTSNDFQMNTSNLPSGMYLVNLQTENAQTTKSLIIK